MFGFIRRTLGHPDLRLKQAPVGQTTIEVLVAELQGNKEGKTILITAGIDGDEYAGMVAAYELIEKYSKKAFSGKLTIIPIVNIPGFQNYTSLNPLDNKYPKYTFPGKEKGSPTERLMYWLYQNYVKGADAWIDLHGGYITEQLYPFITTYQTTNEKLSAITESVIRSIPADTIIYEKKAWSTPKLLAKENILYFLLESGELGLCRGEDVDRHITWTSHIISVLSSEGKRTEIKPKKVFRRIHQYFAPKEGLWFPVLGRRKITKGHVLGEIRSLDGKLLRVIKAEESGIFLWRKSTLPVKKHDIVVGVGYYKEII